MHGFSRMRQLSLLALLAFPFVAQAALATQTVCKETLAGRSCFASLSFNKPAPKPIPDSGPVTQETFPYTVYPNEKELISGWVEYNAGTCVGVSGNWAFTSTTRGSAASEIMSLPLSNGDCPGVNFPFNIATYTWTDIVKEPPTETYTGTWTSPNFQQIETYAITVAHLKINSVNFQTAKINVTLVAPDGAKGKLTTRFTGGTGTAPLQETEKSYVPGRYNIDIVRPQLRKSDYNKLTMKWKVKTPPLEGIFEPEAVWPVKGVVRYTQYNTPAESACSGGSTDVFVVDSLTACTFTAATLKSDFASQVRLNGTGVSLSYGTLKAGLATSLKKSCKGKFPPGATAGSSYLQVASITGSCNRTLVVDSSAAVDASSGLVCRDNLLLVDNANSNSGTRQVLDACPGCSGGFGGTEGHIDSYTSAQECSSNAVGDLGNFWTYKTN